jgi:hypothetical protein
VAVYLQVTAGRGAVWRVPEVPGGLMILPGFALRMRGCGSCWRNGTRGSRSRTRRSRRCASTWPRCSRRSRTWRPGCSPARGTRRGRRRRTGWRSRRRSRCAGSPAASQAGRRASLVRQCSSAGIRTRRCGTGRRGAAAAGSPLKGAPVTGTERRQVTDIPPGPREDHRAPAAHAAVRLRMRD